MRHCTGIARAALVALVVAVGAGPAAADETCQSPYLPKITGQEDYVYVYTLGIEGVGDGEDKLVTVDVRPASVSYGKVISSLSLGGRHEAHHGGLSDDRRYFWLGGLADSRIFIVDIGTNPAEPTLAKTIDDFEKVTGGVAGPHGFYALPGRMLISALSNAEDDGGRTALVEYNNDGDFIRTIWMPEGAEYGYDARVKHFGNTMVLWDFHARKPLQTFEVPGAPLEIRWALGPRHYYAFTTTALTSKLWGVFRRGDGTFEALELANVGDPAAVPLPVDISLSSDDRFLFVASFMDGMVRVFDVSKPRKPRVVLEQKIGAQVNMVSQSWDGRRVYFTSSLLSNWDGTGHEDEQFLKAYSWDGEDLKPRFAIDFIEEKLGRPHIMRFGDGDFSEGRAAERVPEDGERAAERVPEDGEDPA